MDNRKRGSQKEKVLDMIIGSFVHTKEKLSLSFHALYYVFYTREKVFLSP